MKTIIERLEEATIRLFENEELGNKIGYTVMITAITALAIHIVTHIIIAL